MRQITAIYSLSVRNSKFCNDFWRPIVERMSILSSVASPNRVIECCQLSRKTLAPLMQAVGASQDLELARLAAAASPTIPRASVTMEEGSGTEGGTRGG